MVLFSELSSNLRRDITAETSLMNDLDKRLNCEYDSSSGNSELFSKRNVNLFTSLSPEDNFNSPSWLFSTDTSKTTSDNGSLEKSGMLTAIMVALIMVALLLTTEARDRCGRDCTEGRDRHGRDCTEARDRHGRDCMAVEFTTIYPITVYHH